MKLGKFSHLDLLEHTSSRFYLTKEKFKISNKSFQTHFTIKMIINNEENELLRNKKKDLKEKKL